MPDYGHDLAFGTFITPRNVRPHDVVALAQLTERAGLDLATFQDHPYQARFLDTWTLLSWVAAQTETLRVAPNVVNLPLRQPAVLARAAASLDLLSGGRFELGLGAGAFWDAIDAMGGRRLGPGESVDALGEAIDVIRAVWDADSPGGVRVDGEHYRVKGAKRGPAPAHEISIWLGAYKPRMLRLTGAKADGWLPSLGYLQPGDIERSNRTIDEAAAGAGRDPRAVRRLLNVQGSFGATRSGFLQGPPEQWVEELLPLVLEHGFATFFLMADDPRTIEVWGGEVAPALREAVARERSAAGTETGVVRDPKALALRRDGIDYDAVPESLTAVEPGDRTYERVRSTYVHRGSPGLVLRPGSAGEVAEALAFAREQEVELAVRSGGHGIGGRATNDGGIVIDLGRLDAIDVLDPAGRVRLGAGARWGDVAQALAPHGLALSSGDYGGVGVGGLATSGGIGFLTRKHGLTIDRVTAAELVLADGTLVRADAETDPELFWAVRGAGAGFGIVTAVELDAAPVRDVVFATMTFDAGDASALLERWGGVVEAAPRELTSFLTAFARRDGPPVAQLYSVFAGDDADAAVEALTPLLGIGPVLRQQAQLVPYAAVMAPRRDRHRGGGPALVSSGLADHVTPELGERLAEGLGGVAPLLQIRSAGGAVNDVDPQATAYAHRSQSFAISSVGLGPAGDFHGYWDELRPLLNGLYLNFETDSRPARLADAYPGETLERLRRLKALYDPDEVFAGSLPIRPSPLAAAASS
jgi:alkanesulfonate monooxygenase SsuD/methylene tetrahydromethanopterin reductase-like flavin-dependent oxidoreductase (luciferase family)/FAD/FMN-containing dehydrogenase